MRRKVFSDKSQHDELHFEGYFTIPMLSRDEVDDLLSGFSKLTPDNNQILDSNGVEISTDYHFTWLYSKFEYRRVAINLIREVFAPHLSDIFVDHEILVRNFDR